MHADVIKWKHFPRCWPFARGIHRSPVNSPHKGRWRGALMFSLICNWINGWVSHRETGDLKQHHAHYDVIIMWNNFLLPQNFPEQMMQPGRLWFDNLPRSPADNIHKTQQNSIHISWNILYFSQWLHTLTMNALFRTVFITSKVVWVVEYVVLRFIYFEFKQYQVTQFHPLTLVASKRVASAIYMSVCFY